MRPALALGLALSVIWLPAALARPFTVEDLLATEGVGQALFDPSGRWLVLEHRRPWREAAAYDLTVQTLARLTRLQGLDTRRPGPVRDLFPQDAKAGYLAGPFAPDGRHMLVYRIAGRAYSAGVLDLAARRVRWLALTPEQAVYGRAAQWRSAHELVLIARPDGDAPRQFALGWRAGQRLAAQAARTAAGRTPARTRYGSGRFLGLKPERPAARLLAIDLARPQPRRLARGAFVDLELSPDGRWAALLEEREALQPRAGTPVYIARPSRRRALVLVDLATGRRREPCGAAEAARQPLTWSPDGQALLAALRAPDDGEDTRRLVAVDPRTGRCAPVPLQGLEPVIGHSSEGDPRLQTGWRGRAPLVLARPAGGGRADLYQLTARGPLNLTAALPAAPASLLELTPDRLTVRTAQGAWEVGADGATALPPGAQTLNNPEPGGSRILARPDAGPRVTRQGDDLVWRADGQPPRRQALSPDATPLAVTAQAAAVLVRAPSGVMTVELVPALGRRRTVLALNAAYRDITPPEILAVPHAGPQGQALTSWLYLPADRAATARRPLVVIPYRGAVYPAPPADQALGAWNDWANAELLVAAGYAVLIPSLPYDPTAGEPAAHQAEDILGAVDAALPMAALDPDRIGLLGQSFGAFSAVAAASQSPRFRSVVASAGIYDQISLWGIFPQHQALVPEDGYSPNLTNGLVEQGQAHMGAPPFADPARYLRNSPLFAADQITAPVLIVHGQADEIGAFQAQELFSALYRQGKDAQLVTYWGEGHTTASPANIRDKWAIILDWLAQTLGPPPGAAPTARPTPGPRPRR